MMAELKTIPDSGTIPRVEPPSCKLDPSKQERAQRAALEAEQARAESIQKLKQSNPNCKVVL